jgi:hypothetical protein
MHHPYHDHVDKEHEKNYHGTHHITKHYERHNHPDRDHPDNHKNDHHHRNENPTEHTIHHGTHPEHRSHHSHNRVSNPNVTHHNAVHEHMAQQHQHTYIHHQEGKKQNAHHQSPNKIPKAPVTSKPGTGKPKTPPVNPVTPSAPPKVTKSPTGTPGTKPRFSGVAPPHNGLNIGIGNPDPNKRVYGSNEPGQLLASHVSAVNNQGKATTVTSQQEQNPQWNAPSFANHVSNAFYKVTTAWANLGVWEGNTFGGKKDSYFTESQVRNLLP